jgi:hypothetical protein
MPPSSDPPILLLARPLAITKPHALLVEGKDERNFFERLAQVIPGLIADVRDIGGKDKFSEGFKAFVADPGFRNVKAYAVIRDCEADPDATFRSICYHITDAGQLAPKAPQTVVIGESQKMGVFLVPSIDGPGMLEDLCLMTVADHPAIPCLDKFMECLSQVLVKRDPPNAELIDGKYYFPKNVSKAKAQVFMAALHEVHREVGTAAKAGAWNFNHECLSPLKDFLAKLVA